MLLIIIICILFLVLFGPKKNKNFYTIDEIQPKLYILENNHEIILNELNNFTNQWLDWPETYLYKNDKWKVIPIYAFGTWITKFTPYFSKTINILDKIPRVKTILFSKLDPLSIIDPHQGWKSLSNYILRCHLPLIVSNNNFLAVQKEKKFHQLGKVIIFDDSKIHYSANLSKKERITLIIDIERPSYIEKGISTIEDTPELIGLVKNLSR